MEYVGRYSFKVTISNKRIKNIENGNITFKITITALEFIRRFFTSCLPNHFTKIKHYEILSNKI